MTELETLWQALEACTDEAEHVARFKAGLCFRGQ